MTNVQDGRLAEQEADGVSRLPKGPSPGMAEREDGAGVRAVLLDAEQSPAALGPL